MTDSARAASRQPGQSRSAGRQEAPPGRTRPVKQLFHATLQHRGRRLVLWYLVAAISVMLTYVTGPFIQFPFAFVLPVVLAAWFDGLRHALAFAIALPAINLGFVVGLWSVPWTDAHSIANAVIRVCVLSLLAWLTTVANRSEERRVGKECRSRWA